MAKRAVLGNIIYSEFIGWVALLSVLTFLLLWQLGNLGVTNWLYDEAGYISVAWLVWEGHPLYAEVYSPSPPLFTLSLIGGFALWGKSIWAARAVIVVYSIFGLLIAALIAREIGGKWAALATALLLFASPEYFRLSRVTMSEVPALSWVALALLASLRYWRCGRKRWLVLSSLALSIGLLVKLVVIFALPLPGLAVLLRHFLPLTSSLRLPKSRRLRKSSQLVTDGLILGLSAAIPFLLCLLLYEPYPMYEQAFALQWRGRQYHTLNLIRHLRRFAEYLWKDRGLTLLALGGSWWLWRARFREAVLVAAWFILASIMLMAQVPLSTHHMLPLLPPLAILGGVAISRTVAETSEVCETSEVWSKKLGLAVIGACLLIFYLFNLPATIELNRQEVIRTQIPNNLVEDATALLTTTTAPSDTVISDDPLIVLLADRKIPPALTGADWRRLKGGYLTAEQLITMTEEHGAALVFWKDKLDQLPSYVRWVEGRYRAVEIGQRGHRIYLPLGSQLRHEYAFEDGIHLLAARIDADRLASEGKLYIALFWEAVRPPQGDYFVHLKLINAVHHVWGEQEGRPRWGGRPTNAWPQGQILWDPHQVEVLPGTPPGFYQIELSLFDPYAERGLELKSGGQPLLWPVEIPRRDPPSIESLGIEHPLEANLGNRIRFLGYNLKSGFRPGDGIHLTLFWQALTKMDEDYTVFTHLIDGDNHIWAQKDNEPVDGFYPTTLWGEGEIVRDQYDLIIPPEIRPGDYALEVGMYERASGERLPILNATGQVVDDRVLLGRVRVEFP